MVNLLIVLSLVAVAAAAPAPQISDPKNVHILRYDSDNIGLGSYKFGYEQSDGTRHDQQGEVINTGSENESIVMRGSYSWKGPDNVLYTVTYVADENGFQPTIDQEGPGSVPPGVVASLLG